MAYKIGEIVNGLRIVRHIKNSKYEIRYVKCRHLAIKEAHEIKNTGSSGCCAKCRDKAFKSKAVPTDVIKAKNPWLTMKW